jgi:DNA polymerase sigma
MDFCLETTNADLDTQQLLELAFDALSSAFCEIDQVVAVPYARVPIVKFTDRQTGISCDLCFNNRLALYNTRLLRGYSLLDQRIRPLVSAVKHWASRRRLVETRHGYLSSYALIQLVLFFLQHHGLICSLQDESVIRETRSPRQWLTFEGYSCDCTFAQTSSRLMKEEWKPETIGSLLRRFFGFYLSTFSVSRHAVCIRLGRPTRWRQRSEPLTTEEVW